MKTAPKPKWIVTAVCVRAESGFALPIRAQFSNPVKSIEMKKNSLTTTWTILCSKIIHIKRAYKETIIINVCLNEP